MLHPVLDFLGQSLEMLRLLGQAIDNFILIINITFTNLSIRDLDLELLVQVIFLGFSDSLRPPIHSRSIIHIIIFLDCIIQVLLLQIVSVEDVNSFFGTQFVTVGFFAAHPANTNTDSIN